MQGQGAVPRYPSSGHVAKCSQSRTTSATNIGYWTTDDHWTTYNVLHAPTPQPMLQISDLGSAFRHESNVAATDLMLWQGLAEITSQMAAQLGNAVVNRHAEIGQDLLYSSVVSDFTPETAALLDIAGRKAWMPIHRAPNRATAAVSQARGRQGEHEPST
eukprot:s4347_g8.t1